MHLIPLLCFALSPIQIDGSFNDWAKGVTSQEDSQFVYRLVLLPESACLQQLPEQKVVELGEFTIFSRQQVRGTVFHVKKETNGFPPTTLVLCLHLPPLRLNLN